MTQAVHFDLYGTLTEPDWMMLRAGRDATPIASWCRERPHAASAATHAARMGMSAVMVHPGAGSTAMPGAPCGAVVTDLTQLADLLLSAETAPLR